MDKSQHISQLMALNRQCRTLAEKLNALPDRQQLLHAPAPGKWTAIQCVAHLNLANAHYLPLMKTALQEAAEEGSTLFPTGWIGGFFASSMAPNSKGKVGFPLKTFDRFIPGEIPGPDFPMAQFLSDTQQIEDLLQLSSKKDVSGIRIVSAIGPVLKFRLRDAFRFILYHNLRHLQQAVRAIRTH